MKNQQTNSKQAKWLANFNRQTGRKNKKKQETYKMNCMQLK